MDVKTKGSQEAMTDHMNLDDDVPTTSWGFGFLASETEAQVTRCSKKPQD